MFAFQHKLLCSLKVLYKNNKFYLMHFQHMIKRVTKEESESQKNAAAGDTCAAAPTGAQRSEDPWHQICVTVAPGRILQPPVS